MDQVQDGKLIETWDAMVELKKTLGSFKRGLERAPTPSFRG